MIGRLAAALVSEKALSSRSGMPGDGGGAAPAGHCSATVPSSWRRRVLVSAARSARRSWKIAPCEAQLFRTFPLGVAFGRVVREFSEGFLLAFVHLEPHRLRFLERVMARQLSFRRSGCRYAQEAEKAGADPGNTREHEMIPVLAETAPQEKCRGPA